MQPNASRTPLVSLVLLVSLAVAVVALTSLSLVAQQGVRRSGGAPPPSAGASDAASGEWRSYGRDPGGQRFSPLTQITPQNVRTLTRAWSFDTGATAMQVTPLVVDGVMYVAAGSSLFALQPETAQVIWKFSYEGMSRRGLAYWPGDGQAGPRLYTGAADGRMIAVDVKTGQLAADFGTGGVVDLKASISVDGGKGVFGLPSPPAVYKNIIITGGTNGENAPATGRLYGDIRGWDARTGRLLWTFHTVPRPGEPGYETWPPDAWKNRSGTNVWGFMTVDVERGLVFAPIGSPTDDFYGADRHGHNLYGNSLVALDASTGKLKWYQQLVHHDLWDYDPAALPTFIDVRRNGQVIPAVAQITKMGILFIFNRVTGEPIFGMEERPVPQTVVPGEYTAKTQPFPLKPVPLSRMTFDPAKDFNTLTPEHEANCRRIWQDNQMFFSGPYAPNPLEGTVLTFPSTLGGGGFGGVSYNPQLGLVFVNVSNLGMTGRMELRTDPKTGATTYAKTSPGGGPYGRFWDPDTRIPCSAPPFGELVAVNANTGDIAWRVPLGFVEELEARGIKNTGSLTLGGSMATASGLVFIGATGDRRFRAFDAKTGKELWVTTIDADAKAAPMTFMGRDGRQYVVIMAGGGLQLSRSTPASGSNLVAFALPTPGSSAPPAADDPTAPRPLPAPARRTTSVPRPIGPVTLPDGDGKALVERLCVGCHEAGLVAFTRADPERWAAIVHDMVARAGGRGTRDEHNTIIAYLAKNFGPGAAPPATPAPADATAARGTTGGQDVYAAQCMACHQQDGRGRDKLAPTLVGSKWTVGAPAVAIRILLHGKQGAGVMPPLGSLTDDQIAAVLTYIRQAWGNAAPPIGPAAVADVRRQTTGRTRPWTDAELTPLAGGGGSPRP